MPSTNTSYWEPKLAANVARDRMTDESFASQGWTVVRIWEHEVVAEAATRVQTAVAVRMHADRLVSTATPRTRAPGGGAPPAY